MSDYKIIVLISGNGSNLQALIDQSVNGCFEISCVISNKANAFGLQRATTAGIPTHIIDHTLFESREAFDREVARAIDNYNCDLVVLAGFMRILSAPFVNRFQGKLINIHPSLLPKFPGTNTHQRVLDAQESSHGASIHFVTEELDGGPLIAQRAFQISETDDSESLKNKVAKVEHELYPEVVKILASRNLKLLENGIYWGNDLVENADIENLLNSSA